MIGEVPFRAHLFSEPQIRRYVQYCQTDKYSFVHIDATSGIMKKITDQGPPLLYAVLFKDGSDPINNIPLAHAILTDNTVPSISYFLGNLAHAITNYKKKLILPSFFVIDFSAALMNSILQSFNGENIISHLNRCWNVISGKYNKIELRSLSFIHLCCCHVIHAIARSLSEARIDKQIRKGLLHIFALILCSNDLKQFYDILGSLVNIFGNPNEKNAKQKFEDILSLQMNVDEESATMLKDRKKIFEEAEADDQFKTVDEYLRSNSPIIHQSPFNIEAIQRYPILKDLLNSKSKYNNIANPMFSRSIIRIIYRWWAYLPLWTGLLWNFEERYSNNLKADLSVTYCPIRHSNAVIESYFRTLKMSILQKKGSNQPGKIIQDLHRSIKIQFKAEKFGITQNAAGRIRKRKDITAVEKHKKGTGKKCRAIYTALIDKIIPKRGKTKLNKKEQNDHKKSDRYIYFF